MTLLRRIIEYVSCVLAVVAAICLFLMMAQIVVDVVLKFVLNRPIQGNLEIVSFYYMVAVVFLPLAFVELRHEHISVDLFVMMMPKTLRRIIYAMGSVISAVFFALLAYQTFLDAVKATQIGEVMMGTNFVPIWPSRWFLPIGFAAICAVSVLHALRSFVEGDGFDPTPAAPDIASEPVEPAKS